MLMKDGWRADKKRHTDKQTERRKRENLKV